MLTIYFIIICATAALIGLLGYPLVTRIHQKLTYPKSIGYQYEISWAQCLKYIWSDIMWPLVFLSCLVIVSFIDIMRLELLLKY